MTTIEERIQARFHMNGKPHVEHRYYEVYKECVDVAVEQDRISRNDERERCVKIAYDIIIQLYEELGYNDKDGVIYKYVCNAMKENKE